MAIGDALNRHNLKETHIKHPDGSMGLDIDNCDECGTRHCELTVESTS